MSDGKRRGIVGRIEGWCRAAGLLPARPSEIDLVKAAVLRHRARIDEMKAEWSASGGGCCPACSYGDRFNDAVAKLERTRAWLVVLLRRRRKPEDLAFAEACERQAWP